MCFPSGMFWGISHMIQVMVHLFVQIGTRDDATSSCKVCVCVYVDEMHNGGSYLLEKVDKF